MERIICHLYLSWHRTAKHFFSVGGVAGQRRRCQLDHAFLGARAKFTKDGLEDPVLIRHRFNLVQTRTIQVSCLRSPARANLSVDSGVKPVLTFLGKASESSFSGGLERRVCEYRVGHSGRNRAGALSKPATQS